MKIQTTLLCVALPLLAHAQQTPEPRPLTPARGHYKQLQAYSVKPASDNEPIDKQTYPFDKASATRRLSLTPVYLVNTSVDEFQIPDPPANSSPQTKAEITYLKSLQAHRTAEDIRSSLYMADVYYNLRVQPGDSTYARYRRNLFHIGRSVGTWFTPANLPVTADLMANVWRDASYFMWSLKYKYARVRPYTVDAGVKNLQITEWEAYPSGHAANSYVNAFIFQELAPEFADFFIKDAYDMAHSREILGVHYPSDSESSRVFARQFVNKLFQNEKFRRDFELVKEEWRQKAIEKLATQ